MTAHLMICQQSNEPTFKIDFEQSSLYTELI